MPGSVVVRAGGIIVSKRNKVPLFLGHIIYCGRESTNICQGVISAMNKVIGYGELQSGGDTILFRTISSRKASLSRQHLRMWET